MPSAIILAAGSSTRLGQPKQLVRIANETLVERSIRIAHSAALGPIFLIVSPPSARNFGSQALESAVPVEVLINHEAAEGMASSIRLGVRASIEADVEGAIVMACDQIAVTPEHLRTLAHLPTEIRASSYVGRNGIPAYFPAAFFEALLKLTGDTGARDLLRHAIACPLLNGDLDIDTPADLARARQFLTDIASR